MFLTKNQLTANFGVEEEIAGFFIDRKVPGGNSYWAGKHLYMRQKPGYLFIPLFANALVRIGIPVQQVLSPAFVNCFEAILHNAAEEEFGRKPLVQHLEEAYHLVAALPHRNNVWQELMEEHFIKKNAMLPFQPPSAALCRADSFLFAVTALEFSSDLIPVICEHWYAIVAFFLALDDVEDYEKDLKEGEENVIVEWGGGQEGASRIGDLLEGYINTNRRFNLPFAAYCEMLMENFNIKKRLTAIAAVK